MKLEMDRSKLKEFVALLKDKAPITSEEQLEKDFHLNLLLSDLRSEEYVFKGGTCLSKVYLNYHRLSEDLDFTYADQRRWIGKSTKSIKKACSGMMTTFGGPLEEASEKRGVDFVMDKGDRRYVEIGGNNKLATFKVWYTSAFTGRESFVKVQVSYHDAIGFPFVVKTVKPLVEHFTDIEERYFSEFVELYRPMERTVYDVREIACEKIRALLTRRGVKSRDIIDLYFIEKVSEVRPESLRITALDKVVFALENYEKYRENFNAGLNVSKKEIEKERIEHQLLRGIDRKEFMFFVERLMALLKEVREDATIRLSK